MYLRDFSEACDNVIAANQKPNLSSNCFKNVTYILRSKRALLMFSNKLFRRAFFDQRVTHVKALRSSSIVSEMEGSH